MLAIRHGGARASMKALAVVIVCAMTVVVTTSAVGQIDTTRREFYPLGLGDLWQYRNERNEMYTLRVISVDSLLPNGQRYAVLENPAYPGSFTFKRVDSLLRVQQYLSYVGDTCGGVTNEYNIYRLGESDSTWWRVCGDPVIGLCYQSFMRFDGISVQSVFGQPREVMRFTPGCLRIGDPDTLWFDLPWLLARGIGMIQEETLESQYRYLTGAVISGDTLGIIVSVPKASDELPVMVALHQNYPNPFNSSTEIMYEILERTYVRLTVHDVLGREIMKLVDQMQSMGKYQLYFDAGNLASGVYVYALRTGKSASTRRMIILK